MVTLYPKQKLCLIILKVSYLAYAYSLILTTQQYSRDSTVILNTTLSIMSSHVLCEFLYSIILKTCLRGYVGNIQRQEKEKSGNNLEKTHSYLLV